MRVFTFTYSLVHTMRSFSVSLEASVRVGGDQANVRRQKHLVLISSILLAKDVCFLLRPHSSGSFFLRISI